MKRLNIIPYLLAAAIIAWGTYALVRYFKNRKRQKGCGDCRGCGGSACGTCDRSKK